MAAKLNAEKIVSALREGGAVARGLGNFELRESQLEMIEFITDAFNSDSFAAAEAGTGVGKSLAYLLPAVNFALENRERIVISTATITLQEQLYNKDIPLVANSLGVNIKAVLMKGRGNYLCRRRLEDAVREPTLDGDTDEIRRISDWAEKSKNGGKEELNPLPDDSVWSKVCSESDSCPGNACAWRERCFIFSLRKEASDASLIIANHHLLFADLAARKEGAGYENTVVLPPFSRVILDEAHTIEKAATSFFSKEFSSAGLNRFLSGLYTKKRQNKRGLLVRLCSYLPSGTNELDRAAIALEKVRKRTSDLEKEAADFCGLEGTYRLSPHRSEDACEASLFPCFRSLAKAISGFVSIMKEILEGFDEEAQELIVWEAKNAIRRLETVKEICAGFPLYRQKNGEVLWMEKRKSRNGMSVAFTQTPLDMARILGESLFSPNKTVVCVSATLTVNDSFNYWAGRCGIGIDGRQFMSMIFPSPFPYSSAVLLASVTDAPEPDEEGWQGFIDRSVGRLTAIAGGSALVLFTSYQSLQSAWLSALPVLQTMGIRCLKQGDDDRSRLLQTFLADKTSVLFATDSFWEGVDAPGDTLRLVILCRLPFRGPGDPVFEARRELVEKNGGNPFMDLSLPDAVMKFKQGFGRLMRRSSDSGVVAVLDSRLFKKRYGPIFLKSLPETRTSFSELPGVLRDMENFLY